MCILSLFIHLHHYNKTLKENSKIPNQRPRTKHILLHWELAFSRHIIFSQTATGTQCEDHIDFEYAEF